MERLALFSGRNQVDPASGIFPPTGAQDRERLSAVSAEDRDRMMFCLEFCGAVLERRPCHIEALALAAGCYTELGFFADGLKADRMLLSLRPGDPLVLYNLACSFSLNALPDEALAALAEAVENGYADFRHMEQDQDLAALHPDPRFKAMLHALLEKSLRSPRPSA